MARSTYHDQFHKLVDKGYLVPSRGNTFEFYEVPKAATQSNKTMSEDGQHIEECPNDDIPNTNDVQGISAEDIEINNKYVPTNKTGTNISDLNEVGEVKIPEVKEVRIPVPKLEPKKPIPPKPEKKEFIF
jgi:hypothetical protein